MKVLILGAAGQISQMLTNDLLENTNHDLVLYARKAAKRLNLNNNDRVEIIDGDFFEHNKLVNAMNGIDIVYINIAGGSKEFKAIAHAIKDSKVKKVIAASILGIYEEVLGNFGNWNKRMVGISRIKEVADCASIIESLGIDYTILRLTWLYNQKGNESYELTFKGEPFKGAQVSRQAVAKLILEIIEDKTGKFINASVGVVEPNTNWDKPSFY